MSLPAVSIYITSLTSAVKVRSNIELLERSLKGLAIPYAAHDLSMDEDAKRTWHRARKDGAGLPGYLVDGDWVGGMDDFEYAVETGTLPNLLKQDTKPQPIVTSSAAGTELDGFLANIDEAKAQQLMDEFDLLDKDKLGKEGKVELNEEVEASAPDHQPIAHVLHGGGSGFTPSNDVVIPKPEDGEKEANRSREDSENQLDTEEEVQELVKEVEGR